MSDYILFAQGELTPLEEGLATSVLRVLTRHYPKWTWGVDIGGGVLTIRCREVISQMAFRLKIVECTDAAIIAAGGEILERYEQPRKTIDIDRVSEIPRDFRGHHVHQV